MISLVTIDSVITTRKIGNVERAIATLTRLLEPAEPTTKGEIGFHVRERSARYRTKRRF
jgi:hypothetical protein